MNEIYKLTEEALSMLSCLSVSGDAVDLMAAAKHKLRRAEELMKKELSCTPAEESEHGG